MLLLLQGPPSKCFQCIESIDCSFSSLVILLSIDKKSCAATQQVWSSTSMCASAIISVSVRAVLVEHNSNLTNAFYTRGGTKKVPYLTSEPNIIKTPNLACGLVFTKLKKKF